jgi:SSS family transporter
MPYFWSMRPEYLLLAIGLYFVMLYVFARYTMQGRSQSLNTFFLADRSAPWYLIAFAMIGTSISGVTFLSVPGEVGTKGMIYFQVALGYFAGYQFIIRVLLPMYYRLQLTTIYQYLETRFGPNSYRTGSFFFLLSRLLGSGARLFLSFSVLHFLVFEPLGIPFWLVAVGGVSLVLLYTEKGGLRTVIFTDTLQTAFMLSSVVITLVVILGELGPTEALTGVFTAPTGKLFEWDWASENHFLRQFVGGALVAVVMTGLDQAMMQKNLACKDLRAAQKNMLLYSSMMVVVNFFFLLLGGLLFYYAAQKGISLPTKGDQVYSFLANHYFGPFLAIVFLLGLTSAAYSSTDGSMTSLTTTVCVDFLGLAERKDAAALRIKTWTHRSVALAFVLVLVGLEKATKHPMLANASIISIILKLAGYTYAPLLGLYLVGLFTHWQLRDRWVPLVAVLSPLTVLALNLFADRWYGVHFGYELIAINGLFTIIGLSFLRQKPISAS